MIDSVSRFPLFLFLPDYYFIWKQFLYLITYSYSPFLFFYLLQDLVKSTFEDIVSDELKKIKDSSMNGCLKFPTSSPEANDVLWEYDGLHNAYEGECEEILLEMQRIFYEDRTAEPTRKGETWFLHWFLRNISKISN